jgi:hypothetical protein
MGGAEEGGQDVSARDNELAHKAKAHGARYSLRIVLEARRADIPISLGFALVEQESGFSNVFGHDPTIFQGAGKVTKSKYLEYKRQRGTPGRKMQGVGPCQLTWWTYQDRADRYGGCWVARHNIRVAFEDLAELMKQHGRREGLKRYNGSGVAADRYATSVLRRQQRWHTILT